MLNTGELRIGNYVNCEDTGIKKVGSGSEIDNLDESAAAIPLSENLLVNGGFAPSGEEGAVKYYRHMESSLCITIEAGKYSFNYCDKIGDFTLRNKVMVEVKYLHQLQNLYYCLVGKELLLKM